MTFASPLLFLLLIPFGFLYLFWREKKFLGYSSLYYMREPAGSKRLIARLNKPVFFGAAFFAIVAIAHPQTRYYQEETALQGREIILSIDTSFSMTGTAIETIKKIVGDFIKKRSNDLIGITIFGTDAALIVVPTMETQLLEKSLERVQASQVGYQTAIGEGLFTSLTALFEKEMGKQFTIKDLRNSINKEYLADYAISFVKEMEQREVLKNKLIILFTDGIYNIGISPTRPLRLLKRMGIKAYVVAVKASDVTGVDPEVAAEHIEELKEAVESTGGKYYHAENFEEVAKFYNEIDKIERDKITIETVLKKKDLYLFPTLASLIFLLVSVFLENVWMRVP
ncbi:MAG: VWA domain-containing protein [Candidatus Brocadia sinica]|nr:VWA domain-containing protein [Candidatus Brocadia sinica]NUO06705.1 VWA domain-containing protein [Candidatus Brocadia sinica]